MIKILFISMVFSISSAQGQEINFIGCNWKIPYKLTDLQKTKASLEYSNFSEFLESTYLVYMKITFQKQIENPKDKHINEKRFPTLKFLRKIIAGPYQRLDFKDSSNRVVTFVSYEWGDGIMITGFDYSEEINKCFQKYNETTEWAK